MVWKKLKRGSFKNVNRLVSSVSIANRYFRISKDIIERLGNRISVFVNEEEGLVGLKRDEEEGYHVFVTKDGAGQISRDFGFERGVYPVEWDEEEQMFVGKIKFKEADLNV